MRNARLLLLLPVLALALAGCGGGGSSSKSSAGSSGNGNRPNGGGGVNGISVANCLNDENFLVSPSQTTIDGTSPAGVSFSLLFFADDNAAKGAYAKKNPKTTALVENAVVDFKGNPSGIAGAPPANISPSEVASIRKCIDANKTG